MSRPGLNMALRDYKELNVRDLIRYKSNSRTHSTEQIEQIVNSIREFGFTNPLLIDENNTIIAGHGRLDAAISSGLENVPCIVLTGLSDAQKAALVIADNKIALNAGWDIDVLRDQFDFLKEVDFDLALTGFDQLEIADLFDASEDSSNENDLESGSLHDKFLMPPFSVLDARQGAWQNRKRLWNSIGIKSQNGRDVRLMNTNNSFTKGTFKNKNEMPEESVFDPALTEVIYTWFSAEESIVLDPFSGGSVRGIVAGRCKRKYIGVDVRQEQIDANLEQLSSIDMDGFPIPAWIKGDSRNIKNLCKNIEVDLVFSCPPYADLEVYSDDPNDISNLGYEDFMKAYREIIANTCSLLKANRFACFVVGDIRDKKGLYRNFVSDTIQAFLDTGLKLYNEAILITAISTLCLRAGSQFTKSRKLGKGHQNVLVFVKGDPKLATDHCGEVSIADIDAMIENDIMNKATE